MLNYILNYGIEDIQENLELEELDITDKTLVEGQINNLRKSRKNLLALFDEIQGELLLTRDNLAKAKGKALASGNSRDDRYVNINSDIHVIELNSKVEALQASLEIVSKRLDYVASDIRVLTSSMYSKF